MDYNASIIPISSRQVDCGYGRYSNYLAHKLLITTAYIVPLMYLLVMRPHIKVLIRVCVIGVL